MVLSPQFQLAVWVSSVSSVKVSLVVNCVFTLIGSTGAMIEPSKAGCVPMTIGVPFKADTGMLPQIIFPDTVGLLASFQIPLNQYCITLVCIVMFGFEIQTRAVPSEIPIILTS